MSTSTPAERGVLENRLALTCARCGQSGEAPPPHRVPFSPELKERILTTICGNCWKEWEGMEVKVINEYRLNFLDPDHRAMLQRTCVDFLGFSTEV